MTENENENENEGERLSRFLALGHTPGALPETVWQDAPRRAKGFPLTLDLRR